MYIKKGKIVNIKIIDDIDDINDIDKPILDIMKNEFKNDEYGTIISNLDIDSFYYIDETKFNNNVGKSFSLKCLLLDNSYLIDDP